MDLNHQYLLQLAVELNARSPGARILDYGCGKGEIVEAGRNLGLQVYGTDIFYDPNPDTQALLRSKGLLGDRIREIRQGCIPFEDQQFDLVASNMVFEHVEDMESVLREIDRVLKPGGLLVAMFPTLEVWREAHTGIPFAHWWKKGSRIRLGYTLALRALGFGTFKTRPFRKWAADMLGYLDNYCYYRPQRAVEGLVPAHFAFAWMERHHAAYRLRRTRLRGLVPLLNLPGIGWLAGRAFTRVAFGVLVARKAGGELPGNQPSWLPRDLVQGRAGARPGSAGPGRAPAH